MPHLMGVDFIFNNTAGVDPLLTNITQPTAWGSSNGTISTHATVWVSTNTVRRRRRRHCHCCEHWLQDLRSCSCTV